MNSRKIKSENVLALIALALLVWGCSLTVIPKKVAANTASYDGGEQNSGFIGFATNGAAIITPHARDRYNGLIVVYSKQFNPPLSFDAGITATSSNLFLIDFEHLAKFATMNRWRKSETHP